VDCDSDGTSAADELTKLRPEDPGHPELVDEFVIDREQKCGFAALLEPTPGLGPGTPSP
jgi:hypothetical protein